MAAPTKVKLLNLYLLIPKAAEADDCRVRERRSEQGVWKLRSLGSLSQK